MNPPYAPKPTNQPTSNPTPYKRVLLLFEFLKVIKKFTFFNIDEFILIPFHYININKGYQNK
jgi:hypothetical protein